ncbi:unnamed protein product [Adineta steineri]|uniref:F-box domain-containing protein n=1 Tax=Adineta steineri TaxID=433720 RepID=A0A815QYY9_9BILA|nr:unnamed protein product [Adineta steineri]CAF1468365.1 unnamed protein product [Adineta steineri]
MESIVLVILLIICATSSGHKCVINRHLEVKVAEFNVADFQETIGNLHVIEVDDRRLCRMRIAIDYISAFQRIQIQFSQQFEDSDLNDAMISFMTLARNTPDSTSNFEIANFVEYACSGNECDKQFLIDHINWLFKIDYIEFEQKIRPLMMGYGKEAGQCFVDSTVTQCRAGKCFGSYIQTEIDNGQWEQACNKNQGFGVLLQISLKFDLHDLNPDAHRMYMLCQYDKCNEMNIMLEVKSIIDDHYNIFPVLEMFKYNSAKSTTAVKLPVTSDMKYITEQDLSSEFTMNQQSSLEFTTDQQSPFEFTTNQQLLSTSVTKSTPSKTTTTKNKGRRIQITENLVEFLDLPDEMILFIMNKVKPEGILLCSIVNIANHRLERIILDKCYSIDLSFDYYCSSHEFLNKRFYSDLLPCIYNCIQSLIIAIKHLLYIHVAVKAIDSEILPNLRHVKILSGRRRHYTGTPVTISSHYNSALHQTPLFSIVPQFVFIEDRFVNPILSVIRCSPIMRPIHSFAFDNDAALGVPINHDKLFFAQSSYLTHISITLRELSDCVRLLNQLDSAVHSFTVSVRTVYLGDEISMSQIESICCTNLKQLTMTVYRNILSYKEYVLPLLQHLSSVEHLTLLLAIDLTKSDNFIDGHHLQRNIVSYMPNLCQFHFHVRSILRNASYTEIDTTISQSFIEEQSVDYAIDYFNNHYSQCQIYSLPFIGNRLDFISNRFPLFDIKNTFKNVTMLLLYDDIKSFENVFFEHVAQALPRLRTLEISNQLEQEEKTITNPIEFSYLSTLILHKIHMNYAEQLLYRAHLPNLVELVIRNDVLLTIIDQDNRQARNNCSNIETLLIAEPWIKPRKVHLKFFPKISMKNL